MDPSRSAHLRAARDRLIADVGAHLRPHFRPVAYRPVPGYAASDLVDAGMAHVAMADHFEHEESVRQDATGAHMYAAMAGWATYGMAAYLVAPDLLAATHLSRMPGDMPLADLHLPFPATAFILPTAHALRSPAGDVYPGLVIARLAPGPVCPPWRRDAPLYAMHADPAHPSDDLVIVAAWSGDVAPIYAACRPWTGTIGGLVGEVSAQHGTDYSVMDGIRPLPTDDRAFLEEITATAVKLALFASHGPAMAEQPRFLKRARFGVSHGKVDLYEPRWLGRRYRLPTAGAPPVGTHQSPRMHWRCGHFRQVPCGPQRQERCIRWIEPTVVGAPAETPAA